MYQCLGETMPVGLASIGFGTIQAVAGGVEAASRYCFATAPATQGAEAVHNDHSEDGSPRHYRGGSNGRGRTCGSSRHSAEEVG
jgi:hypothetical protein